MYQPAHGKFIESRPAELRKLIRDFPLGTLITHSGNDILVNHTPFILDESGTKLTAHVPRANPVWQGLDGKSALIVFHGPNAYISPAWYAAKKIHGKVVPTWNYAIVHAHGIARVIEDAAWLRTHLEELTNKHELEVGESWKVADAPDDYTAKLIGAIVGIEIEVTQLEGKFKLGQNRSQEDQRGVAAALAKLGSPLRGYLTDILKRVAGSG